MEGRRIKLLTVDANIVVQALTPRVPTTDAERITIRHWTEGLPDDARVVSVRAHEYVHDVLVFVIESETFDEVSLAEMPPFLSVVSCSSQARVSDD